MAIKVPSDQVTTLEKGEMHSRRNLEIYTGFPFVFGLVLINSVVCENNPTPRIDLKMIKGKVNNDAGAQKPGTQLCAA